VYSTREHPKEDRRKIHKRPRETNAARELPGAEESGPQQDQSNARLE